MGSDWKVRGGEMIGKILFAAALIGLFCLARHHREASLPKMEQQEPGVLYSAPSCNDIVGFGGPVPVKITLGADGCIARLDWQPNAESPEYWEQVLASAALKRYLGLTPKDALKLPIDAISGATFSAQAAQQTLQKRLAAAADQVVVPAVLRPVASPIITSLLTFLLLANLTSFLLKLRGWYRLILTVANVIGFGLVANFYLSTAQAIGWMRATPHWSSSLALILFLVTVVLGLTLRRNFYCGGVCPFGCAQELATKLGRSCGVKTFGLNFWWGPYLRRLWLSVVILGVILYWNYLPFEPFPAFKLDGAAWFLTVAAGLVVISAFVPRLWCRWFCTTGALLDFFCRSESKKLPIIKEEKQK